MTRNPTREDLEQRILELERSLARAERERDEGVERFEAVFEGSRDAVFISDGEARFLHVNHAACALTGYTRDELRAMRIPDLHTPKDPHAFERHFDRIMSGKPVLSEADILRKDGTKVPTEFSHARITIGDRHYMHSAARDIAERRRTEEILKRSERRYRRLVETINDVLYSVDGDGVVAYVSPQVEGVLGYKPAELVGERFIHLVHPEDRSAIRQAFEEVLRGRIRPREYRMRSRDGGYRWVRTSSHPDREGQRVVGLHGVLADVTGRKRAEEALRESETRYRSVFENAGTATVIIEEDMTISMANPEFEKLSGWPRTRVEGRMKWTEFVAPEERGRMRAFHRQRRRGDDQAPREYEFEFVDRSGAKKHIHNKIGMIPGTRRSVASLTDITDRRQAEMEKQQLEAQLRQSQKMEAIGTLAGGIAHDFNNLLSAIVGYTEMARMDIPEGAAGAKDLGEVLKASDRAKDLVKQILAFSRQTEHGTKPLRVEPVAKEALHMLRSSLPSSIEIRQTIGPGLPPIIGDPTRIHQVLMNLCTNAAQAIEGDQGLIEVRLEETRLDEIGAAKIGDLPPGPYLRITVRDTGSGIPREIRERIFDPYFTTKEAGEGTGLGLAVVYGIVSDCGGGVSVESEPGQGSSFSLFFPVPESEASSPPEKGRSPLLQGRGERLLFVDDEPAIAKLGEQYFERLGYRVTARQSSLDALELFREDPYSFDAVITDMTMPGMSGDKLAAAMLSIRPDLPIVLCTGYSHRISEARAREIGIRAYVMKPMTDNELANAVRRVLEGSEP